MAVLQARIPVEQHVQFALGHSLGEFAALSVSGILSFEDTMRLVRLRGEAMAKAVDSFGRETAMYALVVEKGRSTVLIDEIEQFRTDFGNDEDVVAVANHNSVCLLGVADIVLSSCNFRDKRCPVEMYRSSTQFLRP
jgi:malonyl CoA-acyl carrier protein transacylase